MACTLDAQGRKIREARIDANAPAAFAAYFKEAHPLEPGEEPHHREVDAQERPL